MELWQLFLNERPGPKKLELVQNRKAKAVYNPFHVPDTSL